MTDTRYGSWPYLAAAALIVGIAFLLRIHQIGQEELWLDEGISFYIATLASWPEALFRNNTPPLYYLLLTAWIHLAGQSESAIRLLTAVFGTLFVAAMIWSGGQIIGRRAALWSGAVSALAPIQIYYAQEARAYALLLLLLALCYGALWRALETNRRLWWGAVFLCSLLALYSHYFASLGLIPTALLVWLWPEKERVADRWIRYAVSVALSVLLFFPWLFWSFYLTPHSFGGIDWIKESWAITRPLLAIPKSLEVFTLGSQAGFTSVLNVKRFGVLLLPEWQRLTGLGMLALLGVWIAQPWMEKELAVPWLGRRKAFLWTLLFFPLVALWLFSFYRPVYAVGRYEVVAFPAYSLLVGLALAKVQSVPKAGLFLSSIVAFFFFLPIGAKLVLYYHAPPQRLGRPTAAAIHKLVNNGDAVILTRARANTTIYYLTRLGYQWNEGVCQNESAGRRFSCPIYLRTAPKSPESTLSPDPKARQQARRAQEFVRDLRPGERSIWVVLAKATIVEGRLNAPPPDSFLLEEIERLGLEPRVILSAPGLFRFR